MKVRALISFTGTFSMARGEVREISDQSLADDLLRAGYIIPLEARSKEEKAKSEDVKAEKPKSKRKGNKDGN